MKTSKIVLGMIALVTMLAGAAGILSAAQGAGWFDMENCSMCAPMMAEKGLMEHMKWENYKVATGMMSITTVEPAYVDAYGRAYAKMTELGEKLMKGEKMPLCGCCESINGLMAGGAKMDNLKTGAGYVMMITATDPALIGKIQVHLDRTNAEMAKMEKPKAEGHQH